MKNAAERPGKRREPPVPLFALLVGVLILFAVAAVVYGLRNQNRAATPVSGSQAAPSAAPAPTT